MFIRIVLSVILLVTQGNTLDQLSQGISEVVDGAKPALVHVVAISRAEPPLSLFDNFFGIPKHPVPTQKRRISASGFFIDLDNGYIVTNAHVVEDAEEIGLKLANGETYRGEIVGADDNTDLAVLRVADGKFVRSGLKQLQLADSSNLNPGQLVVALGAPFLLVGSASLGIISGVERGALPGLAPLGNFIQTDAAINPGNSGGPLLNLDGEVIGVNSAIYSVSGGYNGIGFAIPSAIVSLVTGQLIEHGEFKRGYIGISLQPLESQMRASFHLKEGESGILINGIVDGGPADQAGLSVGDVILAIDGKTIDTPSQLVNIIGFTPPGRDVTVAYLRDGNRQTLTLTVSEKQKKTSQPQAVNVWGLRLQDLPKAKGNPQGVLVVDDDNLKSELYPGDIIVAINNRKIENIKQLLSHLQDSQQVVLYVLRQGQYLFLTLHRP